MSYFFLLLVAIFIILFEQAELSHCLFYFRNLLKYVSVLALNKCTVSTEQIFSNLGHLFALLFRSRTFSKKWMHIEY